MPDGNAQPLPSDEARTSLDLPPRFFITLSWLWFREREEDRRGREMDRWLEGDDP